MATEQIGFKEWSLVCEAMGTGKQSLILRKGSIHEGKGGFSFQHDEFWLFPTFFHAQREQLKPEMVVDAPIAELPAEEDRTQVIVRQFARVQWVRQVRDWDRVAALAPFHTWAEEVVRERFEYDEESCLHLAWARIYRLTHAWEFPYEARYGGCRSWVKLPDEGEAFLKRLTPVLEDEAFVEQEKAVLEVLDA